MARKFSSSALSSLVFAAAARALSVPFSVAPKSDFALDTSNKDAGNDSFAFSNSFSNVLQDIYVANLTVAGQHFVVQLDSGSSDLWLDTQHADISSLAQTGAEGRIPYGDLTVAQGPILIGNVTFGEFTFSQALISAPGTNATSNNDTGLLGVGPPTLSVIKATLQNSTVNGNTVIENILASNSSVQGFTTFQLSRSIVSGLTDGGVFTIGEVDPSLSAVSQAAQLQVVNQQRWVVWMDNMIVNGKNVSGDSGFNLPGSGQKTGQTASNLDTGTSLAQLPRSYVDAIYGSIPGASFDDSLPGYIIPCDTKLNVSFVFNGVEYPIHPIDTVGATLQGKDVVCFGGFASSSEFDGDEDSILGDSFLRNVYALFDYGSFITGSTAAPFIQLLSTTNKDQAWSEFDSLNTQRQNALLGKTGSGSGSTGTGSGSGSNGAMGLTSTSPFALTATVIGLSFGLLLA